jgi:DNA-binding NtrC family response regulator
LRERKEDIPLLAERFMGECRDLPIGEILRPLESYDWPGNVRELKHCVERVLALRSEGALRTADMPSALQNHLACSEIARLSEATSGRDADLPQYSHVAPSPVISIPDSERQAISAALAATNGERGKTAKLLKISRTTLYRRMREYELV